MNLARGVFNPNPCVGTPAESLQREPALLLPVIFQDGFERVEGRLEVFSDFFGDQQHPTNAGENGGGLGGFVTPGNNKAGWAVFP